MEPSEQNPMEVPNSTLEPEQKKDIDISKIFNSPCVPNGVIQYFEMDTEKVQGILEQYEKIGEPLLLQKPGENESDLDKYKRELLIFAFEEGSMSKNFIRNSDGSLKGYEMSTLNDAVLAKAPNIDTILQMKSVEELSQMIGPEITYKNIDVQIFPKEEISNIDGRVLNKEPLFDVSVVTHEGSSIRVFNDVSKEMIEMWKQMKYKIFGQKQNSNYSVMYEQDKTIPTNEALEKLSFAGGHFAKRAFCNRLDAHSSAVHGFILDNDQIKFVQESAEMSRYLHIPDREINIHLIKINLLLSPYLAELKTQETFRKFGFYKDLPNPVIINVIHELQALADQQKERKATEASQKTEIKTPPNRLKEFFSKFKT